MDGDLTDVQDAPVYHLSITAIQAHNTTSVDCNNFTCTEVVHSCYHLLRGAGFSDNNILVAMETVVEEHS